MMFTNFKKIGHEKYKYELTHKMRVEIPTVDYSKPFRKHLKNRHLIDHKFIKLNGKEILVMPGYRSDGASGATFDTPNTFLGAFTHDALYQLMRMGLLPQAMKKYVDWWFYLLLRQEKMSIPRALAWYYALKVCGKSSCALKEFALTDALKSGDITLTGMGMPGIPRVRKIPVQKRPRIQKRKSGKK